MSQWIRVFSDQTLNVKEGEIQILALPGNPPTITLSLPSPDPILDDGKEITFTSPQGVAHQVNGTFITPTGGGNATFTGTNVGFFKAIASGGVWIVRELANVSFA